MALHPSNALPEFHIFHPGGNTPRWRAAARLRRPAEPPCVGLDLVVHLQLCGGHLVEWLRVVRNRILMFVRHGGPPDERSLCVCIIIFRYLVLHILYPYVVRQGEPPDEGHLDHISIL